MSSTSHRQDTAPEAVVITAASPPEGFDSETLSEVRTPFGVAVVRVRRHTEHFHVGGVGLVRTPVYTVAVRTPRSVRERQAPADGGFVVTHPHFLFTGPDRLGYTPGNAAEVHVAVGREIERAVDRKLVEAVRQAAEAGAGADRPPRRARRVPRPQLPSAPGMEEPAGDGPALRPVPPASAVARPFRIVRGAAGSAAEAPAVGPPLGRFANRGHALHAALGAAGVAHHYRFASGVLGRRVASLSALTPDEDARVRAALPQAA